MEQTTDARHVQAYLAKVGLDDVPRDHLRLEQLVAAHNRTIPFENLDSFTGTPVGDLSLEAIAEKLVHRRRGGYCYEQNGLMGHVLRHLGHEVDMLTGRVEWMATGDELTARTHQVLAVTPRGSGKRYLVDVGFGGQTLSSPILLDSTEVQQTRHEPYRLQRRGTLRVLQALVRGEWQTLYSIDLEPQPRVDLEVGSWYVSTHPDSGFVRNLVAALVTDDARLNLSGARLAVHHRDGHSEKRDLPDVDAVLGTLDETFGIDVGELPALPAAIERLLRGRD